MTKIQSKMSFMKPLLIACLMLSATLGVAQTSVAPFLTSNPQFLDNSGNPLSGGCVFTYAAGTTTPLATYSDSLGTVLNQNPVPLNSAGFPQSGGIFLTSAAYKLVVKTTGGVACASGSTITTSDGITWSTAASTFAGITNTGNETLSQTTAATSGANQSSNNLKISGNYWNGSASASDVWSFQDVLGTGTNPASSLTLTHSGSSGTTTLAISGSETISGSDTVNGNGAAGNVAIKYSSSDHVIYVSPNGSDSNDGLSPGTAKLTPQAAIDTATSTGTVSGTVIQAPGAYACPTTPRSNMTLRGISPQYHSTYVSSWGFTTTQNGTVWNCTSGSNLSFTGLTNIHIDGLGINFGNSGGGFVTNSLSASTFDHFGVVGAGSSTQDAFQMKTNATTGAANNTAANVFTDLYIHANSSGVGQQANGLTLTGSGAVNSGTFVTDNRFYGVTIAGGLKNAAKFELNSDTNYIYGLEINNNGTAQGDALVFNGNTPGSDQDVANEVLMGVVTTGSFNHPISVGTASGLHVQMSSAAEITPNVLGGTATYVLETTGLDGVSPVFNVNGTLKSSTFKSANGTAGAPAITFTECYPNCGFFKRPSLNEVLYEVTGTPILDMFGTGIRMNGQLGCYLLSSGDPTATAEDTGWCRVASGVVGATTGPVGNLGGFIQSGNTIRRLTDLTLAANTNLQTIFSWTMPSTALNWSFHCWLPYSQATSAVSDDFGIQAATNAPTRIDAGAMVNTAGAVVITNVLSNLTTTTATNVITFTPSVTATTFTATMEGTLQLGNSANTINIMASQSNSADLLTIKAGSYCAFTP